jgi:hypothetical protein
VRYREILETRSGLSLSITHRTDQCLFMREIPEVKETTTGKD